MDTEREREILKKGKLKDEIKVYSYNRVSNNELLRHITLDIIYGLIEHETVDIAISATTYAIREYLK